MPPQLPPPCLEAALRYLARGWSAIPLCPPDHKGVSGEHESTCKKPGKVPLGSWSAYQERLPRPAELHLWWNRNPNCNVGVATGPVSGILGIDIDSEHGRDLITDLCGGMPDTFNFSTPGGPHRRRLFFKHPVGELFVNQSIRANGKEAFKVLSKGAQTVMPPSIHEYGPAYGLEWEDKPLIDPPTALLEFIRRPTHPQLAAELATPVYQRAKAYLEKCDPCVSGSGGHDKAFWVACKMVHGFALTPEAALQLIMDEYNPRCLPPWTKKEWEHKLSEAAAKGTSSSLLETTNGSTKKKSSSAHQLRLLGQGQPTDPPPEPQEEHFDLVERRPVEWLVHGWIPLGKLTLLDGDPGLGKSTLLLDIAARVSSHGVGFNGRQGPTGDVILLSAEDSAEDTIQPRLVAAGANLERIKGLKSVKEGDTERPPEIPRDLPLIENMIARYKAKLLVLEPLAAYLCGPDANKDQEIRRVLFKLSRIAERQMCAVVTMRHLNKSGGGKAIYRGNMSIGVIGHARVGLIVAEDPDDDKRRVMAMAKINCGEKQPSWRFALEPVPDLGVCRVAWLGESPYSGDGLLAQRTESQEKKQTQYGIAREFITDLLANGPVPSAMIREVCKEFGVSYETAHDVGRDLGVVKKKIGDSWYWFPKDHEA